MSTLTGEYLRNNYASLKDVSEEALNEVLDKMKKDWITTADGLKQVTREDLLEKDYPLGFVNAVKPREGMSRFVSISCCMDVTVRSLLYLFHSFNVEFI